MAARPTHQRARIVQSALERLEDRRLFALVAPTNVQAAGVLAEQVTVKWTDTNSKSTSGTQETGYAVQRKLASEADTAFVTLGTTAPDATRFADTNVTDGTAYAYRVLAVAGETQGPPSATVQVTPSATVVDGLTLGGSATAAGQAIQLTDNLFNQVGSAFTSTARPITSSVSRLISSGASKINGFTASFNFAVPADRQTDPPAEGFAFVLQRDSAQATGAGGSGLGYEGLADSFALKFDYSEAGAFEINQIGVYADGQIDDFGIDTSFDFTSGHTFKIDLEYNDTVDRLDLRITDLEDPNFPVPYSLSQVTNADGVVVPLDLDDNVLQGADAFFGFVGSTGATQSAAQLISNFKLNGTAIDLPAPSAVSSVYVAGSRWAAPFKNFLAAGQFGDAALGYRLGSQLSAAPLPWTTLDQVSVKFNAPVAAAPAANALVIQSSRGNYASTAVVLSADKTSATFTLDRVIGSKVGSPGGAGGERLSLRLAGLGDAGADYVQNFLTLPGDANQSAGAVQAADTVFTRNRVGRSATAPGTGNTAYSPFADFDGNAVINATDVVLVRNRVGLSIPPAPPPALFANSRIVPPRAGAIADLRVDDILT